MLLMDTWTDEKGSDLIFGRILVLASRRRGNLPTHRDDHGHDNLGLCLLFGTSVGCFSYTYYLILKPVPQSREYMDSTTPSMLHFPRV
ncbi:hypothetical protein P692DRAFT_20824552 [Suillus brevipes Sb2]|nr:hypothetical protein P692DRAFT_20824552 [Suillus brevipes Sb2]